MAETKLKVHLESSDQSKTYSLQNEDHTLGNALRHVLMRRPEVSFCGYTVPHPAEPKMHLRLQTVESTTTHATLRLALEDLKALSAHIEETFDAELQTATMT